MTDAPEEELAQALKELRACVAKKRPPGRWEARAVLIPLGRLVLARGEAAMAEASSEVTAAVGTELLEAWERAVAEELSLACAEHIQGTDPRYLAHPRFDWDYVLTARERLEARVSAAKALGLAPPEALWLQVREADERVREGRDNGKNDPAGA